MNTGTLVIGGIIAFVLFGDQIGLFLARLTGQVGSGAGDSASSGSESQDESGISIDLSPFDSASSQPAQNSGLTMLPPAQLTISELENLTLEQMPIVQSVALPISVSQPVLQQTVSHPSPVPVVITAAPQPIIQPIQQTPVPGLRIISEDDDVIIGEPVFEERERRSDFEISLEF